MKTQNASSTRFVRHDQGQIHPVMGDPMRFVMTAADTGGGYALAEQEVRPGNGAPPHIHHNEEEAFYVLKGELTITVNDIEHLLHVGDFLHVPRGVVRSFTNPTDANARVLIMHCPGSASGFYIGMGKLPFPPDLADIKALGDKHGIEIVMPVD